MITSWYHEYPQIVQVFKNYLRNQRGNDVNSEVKKEIVLMLYNNRGLVLKNNKKQENELYNSDKTNIQNVHVENATFV